MQDWKVDITFNAQVKKDIRKNSDCKEMYHVAIIPEME